MKKIKTAPLTHDQIRQRIIDNCGKAGKEIFLPTAMAVAMVQVAIN